MRTVEQQSETVEVLEQSPAVLVDADTQRSVRASSPGVQGPPGDAGAVTTVNGRTGDVVLDAPDVNADPEGAAIAAASAAIASHLADPDPHGQYVADGDILNGGNF
ncbi:hypothetical protein LJB71_08325 [Thermomonas sp. S9]|uniref:hypothetical protein n=1 Tax=Thermomonas sp. S9 TaxID=2885203 RepID=UPI00216AF4BE|nr:hypothetical protein [Thermomonas sp. S9]MCR6496221.1 hypothetical protein [Thermomonas sp. S9]